MAASGVERAAAGVAQCRKASGVELGVEIYFGVETPTSGVEIIPPALESGVEIYLRR